MLIVYWNEVLLILLVKPLLIKVDVRLLEGKKSFLHFLIGIVLNRMYVNDF